MKNEDERGWLSALCPSLIMAAIPLLVYCMDSLLQKRKRKQIKSRLESIEELFQIQLSERSNLRITTAHPSRDFDDEERKRIEEEIKSDPLSQQEMV